MIVYYRDNTIFADVIVTQAAEHEEELMKSDFVKLSWNDTDNRTIPVDAYIIPYEDGIRYSLLEPYYPERKSEIEYKYEPQFQHPKMIYSKVTFRRPSKDSEANDITLLDWSYVGDIYTLLQYFCDQMNEVYGFSGAEEIGFQVIGELNINIANISFQTQDILSALTNLANQCECEWHLDWSMRTLYFGRILFHRTGVVPQLIVGGNITTPSVRNSKDGYWNAFEPQGSTRNITRRAASGEYVLANIRLSLRGDDYPDGIVYTDGKGNIISKSEFEERGERAFVKSLIFEDVFPKLDLYVYNVRYRERYLLEDPEDPESKVISYYDASGKPVYKRYAVWYMNLAYPTYDVNGHVTRWTDYDISEVRNYDVPVKRIISNDLDYYYLEIELDLRVSASWFTNESTQWPNSYIVELSCGGHEVKGYINGYYFSEDGSCRFYSEYSDTGSDERDETSLERITAFQNAISEGGMVTFVSGMNREKFPKYYSQIIDGKSLYGQFKVNTSEEALSSPLAGRGDGDNGNYGFEMVYLGIEGKEYIDDANIEPTDEGDTGIVDMEGNRALATEKDYEIVFQQSGDYILPTTLSQLIIPKGGMDGDEYITDIQDLEDKDKGLTGNIVNLYNIVMTPAYEESAKTDLENRTKKYIALSVEDNNSYSFKSDPISFSERFHTPLYIGEKVDYIDGSTYTALNPLSTRVMKLVTKLDYSFEQEITIGNEVLKGSQQTLKEQVQSMVSYGAGGGGGSGDGGGMSESAMRQLLKNEGAEFFLSKKYDDQAVGAIGFLKAAWFGAKQWFIDNTGSANLFNATINGLLKAFNAVINTVKSTNYTGEGMLDTGWLVTNAYGGTNSKAVFDFLYVRKKALFEELEIRKISHIGGDFALSPASGRAYRVEYYDAEGNQLGVEEMQVPWMVGYKVMMIFSKSKANKYLGHVKKIDRALKPEEKNLVKRVRVYLFSDDGTTQTMSNWTVGAQARCQSFNIEKQMEYHGSGEDSDNPDVSYWTGKKVENTYWWRLVSAVGKGTLSDGKTHDWIEFLCNTGNDYDVADIGSDLPAVGDEFAQFGHRTRPELSNVIMLETARGDSPAIKLYTGINSWDLTGKRVSCISPEMTEFMANRFRLTTDYNGDVQLNDRGLWIDIPTEHILVELPDTWGDVRKCFYNDIVSHNGKWWVCTLASGTHKEDENGHWYTQAELDWLISHDIEKYASLIDVENYTTLEPGDATLQQKTAWTEKTDYLVQVARLEFSNPMFVGAGQHVSTVTLKVSNLSATIDNVIVEDSEGEVSWNGSQIVCNASVSRNRKVKVTAHGILNGMTYTASDVICVYRIASSYSATATPNAFAFAQNENYPYSMNIDGVECFEVETEGGTIEQLGNSCTEIKVMGDGAEQPFRITGVTCVGYSDEGEQHREPGISCSYNNVTGRAWFVLVSNKMVKGKMTVSIAYGNGQTQAIEVPFASSLNGTWLTEIENDTLRQVAEKSTVDIYDDEGHYVKTVTIGEFTRSSSEDTMKLTKTTEYQAGQLNGNNPSGLKTKITTTNERIDTADASIQTLTRTTETQGQQITATNTRVSTAEGNITTLTNGLGQTNRRVETAEGNIQTVSDDLSNNYSTTTQTSTMISNAVSGLASTGYVNTTANNVKAGIKSDLGDTGIDIDAETIKLKGNKVTFTNTAGTVSGKIYIDATTGTLHATNGDFSGKVTATEGSIGGFSIGTKTLSNTAYDASINIQNAASSPTQIAKIGKDATDAMTGLSCSLQAESTKSGTYNTALYLKASGATYNYAFHGEGNGVLNGLVFGFKTKFLSVAGSGNKLYQIDLNEGSTIVLKGSHSSGNVAIAMPKLSNVRQCLGLASNSSTAFAIEINIINLSATDDLVSIMWANEAFNPNRPDTYFDPVKQ